MTAQPFSAIGDLREIGTVLTGASRNPMPSCLLLREAAGRIDRAASSIEMDAKELRAALEQCLRRLDKLNEGGPDEPDPTVEMVRALLERTSQGEPPRYGPWICKQRPAGDWVVDQIDRKTMRVRRCGPYATEPEARQAASVLHSGSSK